MRALRQTARPTTDTPRPGPLRRFLKGERGSMTVEAAIVLPLWIWAYTMSFQFFDAFREQTQNTRAAYTIADMLSRELNSVGPSYIDNLHDVFDYLTRSSHPTWLRISSVYFDSATSSYKIYWSYSTDTTKAPVRTSTTINEDADRLPDLETGQTVVVVETSMEYDAIFDFGLDGMDYTNFIATPPRFASKVSYSASS